MLRVTSLRIVYLFLAVFLLNVSNAYSKAEQKLDINKATVKQLVEVKGIGQAKAEAIVKFIKKKPIKTMDDLLKVRGIGEKVLKNIKEKFEVKKSITKKQDKKKNSK